MTKQTINIGTTANDKQGDSLRAAFQKVNANFTELYNTAAADATDRLVNGANSIILNSTGTLTFPDDLTISNSVFERRVESGGDAVGSKLVITDNDISIERYLDPDGVNNIERARVYADNSGVGMSYTAESVGGTTGATIAVAGPAAQISSTDGVLTNNWLFDAGGATVFPGSLEFSSYGNILQNNSITRTTASAVANGSGVIWSSSWDYISSAKLVIQLEVDEVGDATGWHSQVCEAVIAARGYASSAGGPLGDPVMTVYAVTYTSTVPLVTFTVQRNVTTNIVEVVGTTTAATTGNPTYRIHSVEMVTKD